MSLIGSYPQPVVGAHLRTSGTLTAATQAVPLPCDGYGQVLVHVSGTYNAAWRHQISLDGGTTWVQVWATQMDTMVADYEIGNLVNVSRGYRVNVDGATHYRLYCSSYASGTVNVALAATTLPAPTLVSAALVGAAAGNTPISVINASGNNALAVAAGQLQTGTTSGNITASGQTVAIAATGYQTFLFTVRGTYAGFSGIFQFDIGGGVWFSILGSSLTGPTIESGPTALSNASRSWLVTVGGAGTLRLNCTALTSGTVNVTIAAAGSPTAHGANVYLAGFGASLPEGYDHIGEVSVAAIAPGDNNIGNVDVVSLPMLPSGNNNIGDVDVASLPGDFSTNSTIVAASGTVVLSGLAGVGGIALQLTGAWSGTIKLQGTVDGSTWVDLAFTNAVINGAPASTTTSNGIYRTSSGPYTAVRAFASAWTSGTANVTLRASRGTGGVALVEPLPIGYNPIGKVDQGSAGATPWPVDATPASPDPADYLPVRITDGGDFVNGPQQYVDGANDGGLSTVMMARDAAGGRYWQVSETHPMPVTHIGPLDVDVLSLPELPAGDQNIGNVDLVTWPGDHSTSANITGATQAVTLNGLRNVGSFHVQLAGTWVGSIKLQGTVDGSNWVDLLTFPTVGGVTPVVGMSTNGVYRAVGGAFNGVRAYASAWTSGTANIVLRANPSGGAVSINEPLPAGTNVLGQVGASSLGMFVDGWDSTSGATTDADTANTKIGRLKKIVGLLNAGLPSALDSGALAVSVQKMTALVAGTARIGKVNITDDTNTAGVDGLTRLKVVQEPPPSFIAVYDAIQPGNNKYMATLFNASATRRVIVHRIWYYQWTTSAVTGVGLQMELRYLTARTAGTSVTPLALDDGDTLSGSITADHASTSVTEMTGGLVRRFLVSSEEAKTTAAQTLNTDTLPVADWYGNDGHLVWSKKDGVKGLVLRQNRGISLKCITNSTVGAVSFVIEFSDEPI